MNLLKIFLLASLTLPSCMVASAQIRGRQTELEPQSLEMRIVPLLNLDVTQCLALLTELGFDQQASITAIPPNQIVVRAPDAVLQELQTVIDSLDQAAQPKKVAPARVGYRLSFPKGAQLQWVGGRGGVTSSVTGTWVSGEVGAPVTFRLSQIPGQMRLVVEVMVEVVEPQTKNPAETLAVIGQNLVVKITEADLARLADGSWLTKTITGLHVLSTDHTELFGELVAVNVGEFEALHSSDAVAFVNLKAVVAEDVAPEQISRALRGTSLNQVSDSDVTSLMKELEASERTLVELSTKLTTETDLKSDNTRSLQVQLAELVASAFAVRQKLQLAQIQQQQNKLDLLKERVLQREKSSQQIIEQRIRQLAPSNVNAESKSSKVNLNGDVSLELIDELDLVILKGKKEAVDDTRRIIDKIKSGTPAITPNPPKVQDK